MRLPSLSKQRLLLFLIACAGIVAAAVLLLPGSPRMFRGQVQPACPANGLVAYWPFDEMAGTTTADASGNGHSGTLEYGPVWTNGGTPARSRVLRFDGNSPDCFVTQCPNEGPQVRVANSTSLAFGTTSFTVSLFLQVNDGGGGSVLGNYFGPNEGVSYRGWGSYLTLRNEGNLCPNARCPDFYAYGSEGVNDVYSFLPPEQLANGWHHFAGVYKRNGSSVTIDTYVDGIVVKTNQAVVGDITPPASSLDLLIGRYRSQPHFKGMLDDIRIYDRALGAGEVTSLAQGCGASPQAVCGNSSVEQGEVCDQGSANGTATSCCSSACTFNASGTACRAAAGSCDIVEVCTGSSSSCPADAFQTPTTVCRASADVCDTAENCTGVSAACPGDVFTPSTTPCRPAVGVCDVVENCTGGSAACPINTFASSSMICRNEAAGGCDVLETCTGSDANCPGNAFEASGIGCPVMAGFCSAQCQGGSDVCMQRVCPVRSPPASSPPVSSPPVSSPPVSSPPVSSPPVSSPPVSSPPVSSPPVSSPPVSSPPVSSPPISSLSSSSSSSSALVTVKRTPWCCTWKKGIGTVEPISVVKKMPSWIPTFLLSAQDVVSCKSGNVILRGSYEEALRLCTKNDATAGTVAGSAPAAPPSEGISSAAAGEASCSPSIVTTITSALKSFLSLMSFGVIEKPAPSSCT